MERKAQVNYILHEKNLDYIKIKVSEQWFFFVRCIRRYFLAQAGMLQSPGKPLATPTSALPIFPHVCSFFADEQRQANASAPDLKMSVFF